MSWYQIVEGGQLEQGDLIQNCPLFEPAADLTFPLNQGEDLPVNVLTYDVVVMTNSCDLEMEKVEYIAICPHWDLKQAAKQDVALGRRYTQDLIRKGNMPRYAMLAASGEQDFPLGVRIVDFGTVFSLPKAFVSKLVATQGKHLRLNSPYREHLSQAFGRFFMRVALPEGVDLPK